MAGIPNKASRKKYTDCGNRILTVVKDYENKDILVYLQSIDYNQSF